MVIGLIICLLFGVALGWLGYSHFLKHAERRSDKRANDAWRLKKAKNN